VAKKAPGLPSAGHIPEKDGILACLLVGGRPPRAALPSASRFGRCTRKLGRDSGPSAENLHLSDEQKANAVKRVAWTLRTTAGRKVVSIDRTDGAKLSLKMVRGCCWRLSGTEPLLRLYVEAESASASAS